MAKVTIVGLDFGFCSGIYWVNNMIQKLSLPVSVILEYDQSSRVSMPKKVKFEGRYYDIIKLGFHHIYREGKTLYHVFSVASSSLFFRLVLNTDSLQWMLEEICDGEVN